MSDDFACAADRVKFGAGSISQKNDRFYAVGGIVQSSAACYNEGRLYTEVVSGIPII